MTAEEILAEECSKIITNPVQKERWLIVAVYVQELIEERDGFCRCLRYELSGPG